MYKALISFGGVITMNVGDVKEIPDVNIAKDLVKAGYIEEVRPADKAKAKPKTTAKKTTRTTKKG